VFSGRIAARAIATADDRTAAQAQAAI